MSILEKFGVIGYEDHKDTFTEELGDPNIDPVEALEAVGEAMVETAIAETDLEVLEASYEALTEHAELMADLAAKRPDDKVATIVAYESFRINLKMLGADPDKMTSPAGYEDINAGYESVEGTADKVWKALKEAVKKLWEAIVRFVGKVVDFVMGLFGKREITGEKLVKMLEKLKEEGKTKLPDDAKFEESVAKTLAGHNVMAFSIGEGTTPAAIDKYFSAVEKVANDAYDDIKSYDKVIGEIEKMVENVKKEDDFEKVSENIKNILKDIYARVTVKKGGTLDILSKELKKIIREVVDKKFGPKYDAIIVGVTGIRADRIKVLVYAVADEVKHLFDDFKPTSMNDVKDLTNKILNGFKIEEITVDNANTEIKPLIEKYTKELKPYKFDEAMKVAMRMKTLSEMHGKRLKDINKLTKDYKEKVAKLLDKLEKESKAGVMSMVTKWRIRNEINKDLAKRITAYAETAADLAKSKIGMIVNESTKLYVKEGEEKKEEK